MKTKQLLTALACGVTLAACSPQENDVANAAVNHVDNAATESTPVESAPAQSAAETVDLKSVLASPHRTDAYAERDRYRHPAETLEFFGITADMEVVEISPGGGWYTEILAPYLKEEGTFYAAHFPANSDSNYFQRGRAAFKEKLAADGDSYSAVQLTEFDPAAGTEIAPAGSADAVLTFRNVHNWMHSGNDQKAFDQFFATLKPGGVLGVVEHRAKPDTSREDMISSGYVTQGHVIELAKKAGFELEEVSEVNANPKDSKDHPGGVWTLPPALRLGDEDRDKYLAIGESDRMTLRFRKPTS